jgi:fibronectin-binding autotransporter adhesin
VKICTLKNPITMKTPNPTQPRLQKHSVSANPPCAFNHLRLYLLLAAGLLGAVGAQAASQTWTNAPVDATWTNINNWVARAVPGQVNNIANNGTDNSIATNNTPIFSGIGGAGNPIIIDDATVANGKGRMLNSIIFDTINCGAYVFYSPSPQALNTPTTPETGTLCLCHNGSVTLNAAVTSSQTFIIPVGIRIPSSTDGIFNLVNNATSSSATLFIANMFLDGAATRGVTFVLDGTNTGTNTIAYLSQSPTVTTGISGIRKQGTGTWILPGVNNFRATAPININAGMLIAQNTASFGSATTATVSSNGILRIDAVTLAQTTLALNGSGIVRMNGSATVNGVSVSSALGTSPTLATTSSSDVMTIGNAANQPTGGAADSVLHVAGPGTVLLSQSANYAGKWSLDAGTTQLGNSAGLGTGANLNIAAGATFDVSPLGAVTYTLTESALSASGTGTTVGSTAAAIKADASGTVDLATGSKPVSLTFTPMAFSGDTAHPALYISQGTLSLGGNTFTVNNASGTALGVGTYRLIQQASGNITSGGSYAVNVTGSGLASGNVASIQVTGGNVNLVVSPYVGKNLVWTGGNPNTMWDIATDANWLNGASHSVFNNSDLVVFNAVGSTNPTVTLSGTLAPGSVTVDTTANNYTFSGSGNIAGTTGLAKKGTGALIVSIVNTYLGGTTVSNGTLQLGVNNALPGTSDVAISNTATLDLNAFSDTIGALTGNGTVDTVAGGTPVLTVGNNDDSGIFSGVIQNTSGTLGLTKAGNGTETLASANTYAGPTTLNAGTLTLGNPNALGSGNSAVTINNGTLDLNDNNAVMASLTGAGGTVANSGATVTTNTLTVLNGGTTYSGVITENSSGSKVQVVLLGTSELHLNGNNTYSGGTLVGGTATISSTLGGAIGTGSITLSNGTTLYLHQGSGGVAFSVGNNVTIPDNSAATFNSSQLANGYYGTVTGSATATNLIARAISLSANNAQQYQPFLGTVIVQSGGELRWGAGLTINNGGDNTTFDLEGTGFMITRGGGSVSLGALTGNGSIQNPAGAAGFGNYTVGAKGVDCAYAGTFSGSNNLVKVGAGTMTFNGVTNVSYGLDGLGNTTTNYIVTNMVVYIGATTINNGVLALIAPNNFNGDPSSTKPASFTLAGSTAVLDLSSAGSSPDGATLVTNSTLTLGLNSQGTPAPQTLNGIGTIRGSLIASNGTTVSVGFQPNTNGSPVTGLLNITNSVELAGAVNMNVSATNTPNASELLAQSFTVDGTATLVVTNLGPENAATFQLFNHPVSFTSVVLPTLTGTNSWVNHLAVNGSITLVAPPLVMVNTNSPYMTNTFDGTTLTLSWPADRIGSWRLQSQTNSLSVGLWTNWVEVAGTSATNKVIFTVDKTKGTVFYRLIYP